MIQAINSFNNNQAQKNTKYFFAPQSATNIELPTAQRNYTLFDKEKVDYYVAQKEQALPYLKEVLATSKDEKQIVEALYIVDRLIDSGTKGIPEMYPVFSRFNNSDSPHIQTFLAGIYRKTQVPDAFGPLVAMLVQNSIKTAQNTPSSALQAPSPLLGEGKNTPALPFDPNEEIGGAILAYLQNYSQGPKKLDYTA